LRIFPKNLKKVLIHISPDKKKSKKKVQERKTPKNFIFKNSALERDFSGPLIAHKA